MMTIQELSDHVGERIMCPHVAAMERAHIAELRAREPVYVGRTDPGPPKLAHDAEVRARLYATFAATSSILEDAHAVETVGDLTWSPKTALPAVGWSEPLFEPDPYVWHDTSEFDR